MFEQLQPDIWSLTDRCILAVFTIWIDWLKKCKRVSTKLWRYIPCLQQQAWNVVPKAAHSVYSLSYHRSQLWTDVCDHGLWPYTLKLLLTPHQGRDTVYTHQRVPCPLPLSTIHCWLIRIAMETYATWPQGCHRMKILACRLGSSTFWLVRSTLQDHQKSWFCSVQLWRQPVGTADQIYLHANGSQMHISLACRRSTHQH